jgi:hypothetical protein
LAHGLFGAKIWRKASASLCSSSVVMRLKSVTQLFGQQPFTADFSQIFAALTQSPKDLPESAQALALAAQAGKSTL